MRFSVIYRLFLMVSPLLVIAQAKTAGLPFQDNKSGRTGTAGTPALSSHIIQSSASDTAYFHIEMQGASYNYLKKRFPYYIVSKTTPYNQTAMASLQVKSTLPVSEPNASIIKKYFSAYLSQDFNLVARKSLSRNENLNQHQLFPFRLNNSGQVEELIDYEVSWRMSSNTNAKQFATTATFTNNSVLSGGDWYKIGITQTGIYKISKAFLTGLGIQTSAIDPRKIQIYGNGGKMLPERNSDFRYDDLQENAIQVIGESDGVFGNDDYILFYATGPHAWNYSSSHTGVRFKVQKNLYSDTSYYFITIGSSNGKRVSAPVSTPASASLTSSTYDYYNFHEVDQKNFARSGRDFYGEYFDITTSYNFGWTDGDFVTNDTIRCSTSLVATSTQTTNFSVTGNGISFGIQTPGYDFNGYLADYAMPGSAEAMSMNTDPSAINITVSKLTSNSVAYLDKITVNARRKLNVLAKQYCFRDCRVYGSGKACSFSITNPLNAAVTLWNVTNPLKPNVPALTTTGGIINFLAAVDSINEFCITPATDFYTPSSIGKIQNQNLHNIQQADYLLISHPLFVKEAQELGAFHQQKEGLSYQVVTTEQIYNEFSSGRQDISGIRDFIRMVYSRTIATSKPLKYVLLLGDGSYDNHTRSLLNNTDYIPTYQSLNSLSATASITSDDFYALMDPNEGYDVENSTGTVPGGGNVDLGVGRLVCKSEVEARGIINKIENYYKKDPSFQAATSTQATEDESPLGDWRSWLLLLADDQDQGIHMQGAENLAAIVKSTANSYNVDKIYLDAYQRYSTPGGHRYPDAAEDFLKRIKKGALIFNYTGHGGEVGLTEERIIDDGTINGLDNFNKLPLFITATCEFSRYDDPARTSAGELCLLNPKGAAVALLTTCRIAYSNTNDNLNQQVIIRLFKKLPNGKWPSLGEVIQATKADLGQDFRYANFHLLGDPAMPLAYPPMKVFTSKINSLTVDTARIDTISALEKVTITGFVADTSGNKLTNFNGIVYPTVFDKEQDVVCLVNDPASSISTAAIVPFQFKLQKNILYRGKAQVTNGDFSFTFIVPKDISFSPGPGRISYYATDGNIDANGYYKNLVVGGESKNKINDTDGPAIGLYFNDKSFVNGGVTDENPILYANLTDSSGINTLGTSIGHDISGTLDQSSSSPVILNDYYEANLNSYQSGSVRYPFNSLADGNHRLTFKAWDILNNSSTSYIDFVVAKSAELALQHVLNYPNPFTTSTKFMFEHNQACNPIKVTIQVFTISGKAVKTIQKLVLCDGFKPEPIEWDGRDDYGDKLARGVYIYKLAILDVQNKKAEKIEKLVILN